MKKDINWISQFVTVYTILYTDQISHKDYKTAMYFADKAVEAAEIGEEKLDPLWPADCSETPYWERPPSMYESHFGKKRQRRTIAVLKHTPDATIT